MSLQLRYTAYEHGSSSKQGVLVSNNTKYQELPIHINSTHAPSLVETAQQSIQRRHHLAASVGAPLNNRYCMLLEIKFEARLLQQTRVPPCSQGKYILLCINSTAMISNERNPVSPISCNRRLQALREKIRYLMLFLFSGIFADLLSIGLYFKNI